jgi:hypothetical protein
MWMEGGRSRPTARRREAILQQFVWSFLAFFEDFPSNSLEIKRFGRVWREGNGTAKTSCGFDCAV